MTYSTASGSHLPTIALGVQEYGWIEIGPDQLSQSFVYALDAGTMVSEGQTNYPTLDGLNPTMTP